MPDLIRIQSGSDGKHWPEAGRMILAHQLASGPDPFGQNLTVSQNQIGSGLVLHKMIRAVCGRTQPCLKVGNWWQAGCVVRIGPGDSCTPACFLTICAVSYTHLTLPTSSYV